MSEIKNGTLGLYGAEHSKCNRMMTLGFKRLIMLLVDYFFLVIWSTLLGFIGHQIYATVTNNTLRQQLFAASTDLFVAASRGC